MSRTNRIVGGVSFGLLSQVLTMCVGLWLTPFLLHTLGQHDYGLWLVALQVTMYLGLLDFGVVALLPRETAQAVGRGGGIQGNAELPAAVGRTAYLMLWQLPLVAAAALAVWLLLPAAWASIAAPTGLIMAVFVVMFPLRIFHAVLNGLQDLSYLGAVQIGTWLAGTAVTVALLLLGYGLYSVAAGWAVGQLASAALWWGRVYRHFPCAIPRVLPRVSRDDLRARLSAGGWVSISQIAQVLLHGTDLLVIGRLLGPVAVVPYSVTGKLVSVLSNQPQMVMQAAMPAITELRAGDQRHRLLAVITAVSQAMLLVSGGVFIVTLVVNEGFVRAWVGAGQYGGLALTVLLLVSMGVRHLNTTVVYTIFCFGYERRISVTTLLDGLFTVLGSVLLVPRVGVAGVVIASILGACLVSLPANLAALLRETQTSAAALAAPLWPWFKRFMVLAGAAGVLARVWSPSSLPLVAAVAVGTAVTYAIVMFPVALHAPLGAYVRPRLGSAYRKVPRLDRTLGAWRSAWQGFPWR